MLAHFDDNTYALNATSGAKLWNYTTGGAIYSSAVAGGVIYVDSSDNSVYALNATNGDRLWNFVTGIPVVSFGGDPIRFGRLLPLSAEWSMSVATMVLSTL